MRYIRFLDIWERSLQDRDANVFYVKHDDMFSVSSDEYVRAVNHHSVQPIFKLFFCWEDESIQRDLTPYLLSDGELTISYASGLRGKLSVSLFNEKGDWTFSYNDFLWKGAKFKFFVGIRADDVEYMCDYGVFVLSDFSLVERYNANVYSLELVDKFGAIDGTAGGTTIDDIYVPVGSNIFEMTKQLLLTDKIEGVPFDSKSIHMPMSIISETTPYTINKSSGGNDNIGEVIKTFGTITNSDVFYDRFGHLTFEESPDNYLTNSKPSIWRFSTDSVNFIDPNTTVDIQSVYNIVKVEGGNINGALMDYTAKNTNSKSPTNISIFPPTRYKIVDENISSEELAKKRAEYELYKRSLLPLSVSFNTPLVPHLDVNQIVEIFNPNKHLYNTRFIINSMTIPITQNCTMTINATNIEEVAFDG